MHRRSNLASALVVTQLLAACGASTPARDGVLPVVGGAPSTLFSGGEVVAYTIRGGDTVVGRCHSTYLSRPGGGGEVHTRAAIAPAAGAAAVTVDSVVTFDDRGDPRAFKRLSSREGRLELRFEDRTISVVTDAGRREVPGTAHEATLLPEHDLMTLALLIRRSGLSPGSAGSLRVIEPEAVASLGMPDRGGPLAGGRHPGDAAGVEPRAIPISVFLDPASREVVQLPAGKVTLDPAGHVLRFEDTRAHLTFEREDPPGEPPRMLATEAHGYLRPPDADWTDREVQIDVPDGRLAGTLSEPRQPIPAAPGRGRLAPGVIFLSGGVPQDRNGFAGDLDLGTWEILDRLVSAGFAVLRVDDRGTGATVSRTPIAEVGLARRRSDAQAMLRFMRAQPAVDPDRLFVVGQTEGAIAVLLLAGVETVSGVVLLSPPARPLPELLSAQEVALAGADPERARAQMADVLRALEGDAAAQARVDGRRWPAYASMRALLLESAHLDLEAALAACHADTAIFQGMKDFEVSWRLDAKPLAEALKRHGNKRVKLFVYENVDHLMKAEPGASTPRRYTDRSRRIEPRFLEDLTGWLKGLATRTPS